MPPITDCVPNPPSQPHVSIESPAATVELPAVSVGEHSAIIEHVPRVCHDGYPDSKSDAVSDQLIDSAMPATIPAINQVHACTVSLRFPGRSRCWRGRHRHRTKPPLRVLPAAAVLR